MYLLVSLFFFFFYLQESNKEIRQTGQQGRVWLQVREQRIAEASISLASASFHIDPVGVVNQLNFIVPKGNFF